MKKYINQYDWSEINFPSHVVDWKKFELNNKSVALNVLYVPYDENTIRHAYKSKYYVKCEKQVILLMISDPEKLHYLAVKNLNALFNRVTSNHNGYFYCLSCLHSYRTEKAFKKHMKVCEDNDYCYVEMPEGDVYIKYQHAVKSARAPFVFYADIESLLKRMDACVNNPDKSSTTKINKHEMCGLRIDYALFIR